MLLPGAFSEEAPGEFTKRLIAESLLNRDALEPPSFYARVEVEVVGPAGDLVVPGNRKGEIYRQVNYQDWWVEDQKLAVATRHQRTCSLDGIEIVSEPDRAEPRFVYCFDGERTYYLDFRPGGALLEINAVWPYTGAAHPVLFGRRYTNVPYSECVSKPFEIVKSERIENYPCTVLRLGLDQGYVLAWLAEDLNWLCVREEFHGDAGRIVAREFAFERDASGLLYPSRGVETFRSPRGRDIVTTWTVLEFSVNPRLPEYVFTPSLTLASKVIDRASGEVLKTPEK